MKTAGYYFKHLGRNIEAATMAEINKLAQKVADMTGKPVTVRRKAAPKAARPKPAVRTMKQNPDMDLAWFYAAQQKAQRERAEYVARTKGTRIAKHMGGRGRGQAATRTAEAGARKTARFEVVAKNRLESLTLYRPSRRAADDLAEQFRAAGYTATVREI